MRDVIFSRVNNFVRSLPRSCIQRLFPQTAPICRSAVSPAVTARLAAEARADRNKNILRHRAIPAEPSATLCCQQSTAVLPFGLHQTQSSARNLIRGAPEPMQVC